MKKITQKEIEAILDTFMKCNVPVQVYVGVQELFNKLPPVEEKENKEGKEGKK